MNPLAAELNETIEREAPAGIHATPSALVYAALAESAVITSKRKQASNAKYPIFVTVAGITMLLSWPHP